MPSRDSSRVFSIPAALRIRDAAPQVGAFHLGFARLEVLGLREQRGARVFVVGVGSRQHVLGRGGR
jgi:hypothetical protein